MSKSMAVFLSVLLLFFAGQVCAEEEIPGWLQRTNFGFVGESATKPRGYIETVQPLYQSSDMTEVLFTHDRISIQDEKGTYSAGLGYRRLIMDEELIAGINTFFDFQDLHKHYRQGAGLELIGKRLEGRANGYFALSGTRKIETTDTGTTYERAVNGGDVELGGAVPYVPWLKLFGSYYHYDYRKFEDMRGWQARGEISPVDYLTVNLATYDDNKGDRELVVDARITLAVKDFSLMGILDGLKFEKKAFEDVDLKDRMLDRVERNFNIQVEKWTETASAAIEVRRGN